MVSKIIEYLCNKHVPVRDGFLYVENKNLLALQLHSHILYMTFTSLFFIKKIMDRFDELVEEVILREHKYESMEKKN